MGRDGLNCRDASTNTVGLYVRLLPDPVTEGFISWEMGGTERCERVIVARDSMETGGCRRATTVGCSGPLRRIGTTRRSAVVERLFDSVAKLVIAKISNNATLAHIARKINRVSFRCPTIGLP